MAVVIDLSDRLVSEGHVRWVPRTGITREGSPRGPGRAAVTLGVEGLADNAVLREQSLLTGR